MIEPSTPHVSDLRWDRLLAGELAADERATVLAHADACPACAARRAEITAGFEAFDHVPRFVAARKPRRNVIAAAGVALAAAAAVLLVMRARTPGEESGERPKGGGGPHLLLAAGPRDRMAPVMSGDHVQPGDSIQAAYTATRDGFGAVLARDGSGAAAAYVPADGDVMVPLPAGTQRSYPASTILDEVLGEQALIVVWCETARPLAPLIGELRATGAVTAPAGCTVERMVLDVRGARL